MTLGITLTLFLAAGTAQGNEQNRKDHRHRMCKQRQTARQHGHSRREAKARAWRQIQAARATVGARDWQGAFEDLAHEVLIVAAELAQTGHHTAAMDLLHRVINSVPSDSDATALLERVYDRGPRLRPEGEETGAFGQECEESTCYQFDFGPGYSAWVNSLQQACAPAACNTGAYQPVPCCVPCCPAGSVCPVVTVFVKDADCACGAGCQRCMKSKPVAGATAVRAFSRLALSVTGCAPGYMFGVSPADVACSDAEACSDFSDAVYAPRSRTVVFSSQVTHTDCDEIQDVTVIRFTADGCETQRHYQVQRCLSSDAQSSSRVERTSGVLGRFVHYISTDTTNNCAQQLEDFVPCDDN